MPFDEKRGYWRDTTFNNVTFGITIFIFGILMIGGLIGSCAEAPYELGIKGKVSFQIIKTQIRPNISYLRRMDTDQMIKVPILVGAEGEFFSCRLRLDYSRPGFHEVTRCERLIKF